MELKYKLNDRPQMGHLLMYSMQWFILAVAVVITSLFVAVGSPAERVLYAQKVFALMGIATVVQVFWGHRLPVVVGPAAVLLVGIMTALASQGEQVNTNIIYTSILVGGAAITILSLSGVLERVQRIFTPRIVMVIMMLIAVTLTAPIKNLVFPSTEPERHTFGLWFMLLGLPLMALAAVRLRGVAKSLLVPAALVVGCVVYYLIYGGFAEVVGRYGRAEGSLLLPAWELDGGMIVAFLFSYVALLINDIGSIQSLGAMLQADDMQRRCRRGVGVTGLLNVVAGALGVIGPVNYSMSPGVIASSSCASRYALVPAGLGLVVCACVPDLIAVLSAIPNSVIGVILLYLMGTQLAAAFSMMTAGGNAVSFEDCLVVGLPVMAALVFGVIPINIIPALLRPVVGNGFVMGVILVILLEHIIIRRR
jgi:xanthine/uracil permease